MLRLNGAPLLFIVCSLFGLVFVGSCFSRQLPTDTIAAVGTWFGAPAATMTAAMDATHAWFVDEHRVVILSAVVIGFAAAIGWKYVTATRSMWQTFEDAQTHKTRLWEREQAVARAEARGHLIVPDDLAQDASLESVRKARDDSWALHLQVIDWWSGVVPRLAALSWVCLALALELGWVAVVGLVVVTVATFVASALISQIGDASDRFSGAGRDAAMFVGFAALTVVSLPRFLLLLLFHPEKEPAAAKTATD